MCFAETPVTEGQKVGGEEEGREERSIPKHMQETNTSGTNKRIGSSGYIRIHNITEVGKVWFTILEKEKQSGK